MVLRKRKNILLIILLLSAGISGAQRHDNIWLFGYSSNTVDSAWGGSVMDFNGDSLEISYQYRYLNFNVTNASICDTAGNLLFYTNGIRIVNASHEIMENGNGLNPGEFADNNLGSGYILNQGAMAIPFPGNDSLFYLLHTSRDYPNNQVGHHSPEFYYTLIDMS